MKVDGDRLVITIDLSKEFGESKTGKSITISSTDGTSRCRSGRRSRSG